MPSGGSGGFSFLWSSGETTSSIENLPIGTYFLTVTDEIGCTSNAVFPLLESPEIEIEYSITPPSPGMANGTFEINSLEGITPITVTWPNGQSGGEGMIVNNIEAGIYEVILMDGNGCLDTLEILIESVKSIFEKEQFIDFCLAQIPANNFTHVYFDLNKDELINLELSDINGKIIWSFSKTELEDFNSNIDLSDLVPGIYFVTLKTELGRVSKKLVKG